MGVFSLFLALSESSFIVIQVLQGLVGIYFLAIALLQAMAAVSVKIRSLRLSRDNFEIINLWKSKTIRWNDTGEFTVTTHPYDVRRKLVVCNINSSRTSVSSNKATVGRNFSLRSIYGLKTHEELAALLNAWRARALQESAAVKP